MNKHLLILLIGAISLTGCRTLPDYSFSEDQIEQAIRNLMRCDECTGHQLHHVLIIGDPAKQRLQELQRDGSSAIPSTYADQLNSRWADLHARHGDSLRLSQDAFRETHLTAYKKRTEGRADRALEILNKRWYSGWIGGSRTVEP